VNRSSLSKPRANKPPEAAASFLDGPPGPTRQPDIADAKSPSHGTPPTPGVQDHPFPQRRLAPATVQPLLTLSQVADLLRVSEKTIRRWMLSKRLPYMRLGRVVRFQQDELLRWIEARREV